jgi:micrococcal nuclease
VHDPRLLLPPHARVLPVSILATVLACSVIGAVDGDTFKVRCPVWPGLIAEETLRVRGLDTPEKGHRAQCDNERKLADEASALAKSLTEIQISNLDRDKYGRLLADVFVAGKSWADTLVEKKLAVPYDGGTKHNPWCR